MPVVPTPPPPDHGRAATLDGVSIHLDGLWTGPLAGSERFTGGMTAAGAALEAFDVRGYGARRNDVWPEARRGASGLSPWIRHGLLPLPAVWDAAGDGPARDVRKFRDELLWQEFARHLYARLGAALSAPVRYQPDEWPGASGDGWPRDLACLDLVVGELERDGWAVNQTRMWLASQWTVRHHLPWRKGEDAMFRHLVDGSRAANRLGWQWTIGAGTGRSYGFSRWQVTKRAPGLCHTCAHEAGCPIQDFPADVALDRVEADPRVRSDPDPAATGGPSAPELAPGRPPEAVWLTAESLGDDDPALAAHPDLPVAFTFDRRLLEGLGLSAKRLVFLAECLGDLGERRDLQVHVGDPVEALAGRPVAATFTPVPGWRRLRRSVDVVAVHPWPWLRRPGSGSLASFSAWRKGLGV